jgi:hypothetical protein
MAVIPTSAAVVSKNLRNMFSSLGCIEKASQRIN